MSSSEEINDQRKKRTFLRIKMVVYRCGGKKKKKMALTLSL